MGEQGRRKKREKEERTGLDKMGGGQQAREKGWAGWAFDFFCVTFSPPLKNSSPNLTTQRYTNLIN